MMMIVVVVVTVIVVIIVFHDNRCTQHGQGGIHGGINTRGKGIGQGDQLLHAEPLCLAAILAQQVSNVFQGLVGLGRDATGVHGGQRQ